MTAMIRDSFARAHGEGKRPPHAGWPAAAVLTPVPDVPQADRALVMAAFLLGVLARGAPGDPGAAGRTSASVERHLEALTHGETRVLHYLPTNLSAREIAGELYLSVNTVKTHQRHLYRKLGACSRTQAVERARALGLLAPSPRRR